MAGFWFLGEKSISVSFTNVTFRLMNLNIYFFIRFETIFIWKTVFVTFFTKDSKRERKRMLQHHLASRRKNTNQTNWWILQCITTNCVDLWEFMRRIYLKSVSFVPFRPVTLGFYFIPIRIYQDLTWILMTHSKKKWKNVHRFRRWPLQCYCMQNINSIFREAPNLTDPEMLKWITFLILWALNYELICGKSQISSNNNRHNRISDRKFMKSTV